MSSGFNILCPPCVRLQQDNNIFQKFESAQKDKKKGKIPKNVENAVSVIRWAEQYYNISQIDSPITEKTPKKHHLEKGVDYT
jgi:hypothetical protein